MEKMHITSYYYFSKQMSAMRWASRDLRCLIFFGLFGSDGANVRVVGAEQ
jgi:hypothetical protein